jgi:hypothetical protein
VQQQLVQLSYRLPVLEQLSCRLTERQQQEQLSWLGQQQELGLTHQRFEQEQLVVLQQQLAEPSRRKHRQKLQQLGLFRFQRLYFRCRLSMQLNQQLINLPG